MGCLSQKKIAFDKRRNGFNGQRAFHRAALVGPARSNGTTRRPTTSRPKPCKERCAMASAPVDDTTFAELSKIDTPTITNVVATYPRNPLCLGLYNPWTENWYTGASIRCMYPELGAVIGYAVTCVFGLPDPNFPGRLTYMDVVDALYAARKPTILVIQQKWPAELMMKAGLVGELMATSMRSLGCVGLLSNGPSRDIDAARRLRFQMLLGGVT